MSAQHLLFRAVLGVGTLVNLDDFLASQPKGKVAPASLNTAADLSRLTSRFEDMLEPVLQIRRAWVREMPAWLPPEMAMLIDGNISRVCPLLSFWRTCAVKGNKLLSIGH